MTRILRVLILAAVLAVLGSILNTNNAFSATLAGGACGGGNTVAQAIAGWQAHGVLDDVARSTGQTPRVDGSSAQIVRAGMVKTIVVKGGWVTNFTCKGGTFVKLKKKKYIPAGAIYWVPARLAPKPCKQGRTHLGYQANCGNKQVGNLVVRRLCASPKPTPTPTQPSGNCNVTINGNNNQVFNCTTIWVVCGVFQAPFTSKGEAEAWAKVNCAPATPPTIITCTNCASSPPPCTTCQPPTCTANCVPPKDGTVGPGTGTPGQPGGPGAGGQPGQGAGPMCRDANGNPVPGTPDPVTGNCPGVTDATSGGTTTTGPTPPPAGQCIDPFLMLPRPGPADQYGYCV